MGTYFRQFGDGEILTYHSNPQKIQIQVGSLPNRGEVFPTGRSQWIAACYKIVKPVWFGCWEISRKMCVKPTSLGGFLEVILFQNFRTISKIENMCWNRCLTMDAFNLIKDYPKLFFAFVTQKNPTRRFVFPILSLAETRWNKNHMHDMNPFMLGSWGGILCSCVPGSLSATVHGGINMNQLPIESLQDFNHQQVATFGFLGGAINNIISSYHLSILYLSLKRTWHKATLLNIIYDIMI